MSKREYLIRVFERKLCKKEYFYCSFLNKISKSKVYVCKKTGLVFHKKRQSSLMEKTWSGKLFKINQKKTNDIYSPDIPLFQSRYYYILNFVSQILNLNKKTIFDFGSGQGNFLSLIDSNFNCNFLYGSELSKKNIDISRKRIKSKKIKFINSNIESLEKEKKIADVGFLLWTLCCLNNPVQCLKSISSVLKKNGTLVIAESSRILVPFKKPIDRYFSSKTDQEIHHPFHFSYNSLSNLLKICNFKIVKTNLFLEEDIMLVIAKKINKNINNFKFDDSKKVIQYLQDWKRFGKKYNDLYN